MGDIGGAGLGAGAPFKSKHNKNCNDNKAGKKILFDSHPWVCANVNANVYAMLNLICAIVFSIFSMYTNQ